MPPRSRTKSGVLVVLLLLLAVVGSVSYLGWRQSVGVPEVGVTAPRVLGQATPVTVTARALGGRVARLEVRLVQGGRAAVAPAPSLAPAPRVELPITLQPAALGLREGGAVLEVWARDDFWRPLSPTERALASLPVTVDLTPPRLEVLAATRYVSPGGAVLVAFRAGDAARVEARVGDRVFPSFPYGPPERGARVALLALPYDVAPGTPLTVVAADEAGNTVTRGVPVELKPRAFPRDTIRLSEAFLQAKVPELYPERPPAQSLLDGFLHVNRELRRRAEEEKRRVGATTADRPLWAGPFRQPRNTKVFANFAETRSYLWDGREVDSQVHYGYDLASVQQSPVPAANAGVVLFAGPLTIYGNTVIVDHGLGLQSLYAHLSSIEVKPGDQVEAGHVLGRTGTTGLASGDHLHFEVLISGVSVTPLEWWDPKWIRDRINEPLLRAGLPEIR